MIEPFQELVGIQKGSDLCTFISGHLSASMRTLISFLAIAVACRDVDVRNVKALIIGPPDTPYEFGFFDVC